MRSPAAIRGVRLAVLLLSLGLAVPALRSGEPVRRSGRAAAAARASVPAAELQRHHPSAERRRSCRSRSTPSTISFARCRPAGGRTGVRYSGQSVTIRISFKRNGEVLGKPMITHYREGEPDAANQRGLHPGGAGGPRALLAHAVHGQARGGGGRSSVHLPLRRFPGNGKIAVL